MSGPTPGAGTGVDAVPVGVVPALRRAHIDVDQPRNLAKSVTVE